MRKRGEKEGVYFTLQGWCIKNLAYEYKLCIYEGETKTVYVDNMKDLKREITNYNNEVNGLYEES